MIFKYQVCLYFTVLLFSTVDSEDFVSLKDPDFIPPNTDDCEKSSKDEQIRKCTNIFSSAFNLKELNTLNEAFSSEIQMAVDNIIHTPAITQNILKKLCLIGGISRKCFESLIKICPLSDSHVRVFMDEHPIEGFFNRFCSKDGLLNDAITELFMKNNLKECLSSSDANDIFMESKKIMKNLQLKLKTVKPDVFTTNLLKASKLSPSEQILFEHAVSSCRSVIGAVNRCHQILRQRSEHSCNEYTTGLLSHIVLLDYPTGIGKFCRLPSYRDVVDYHLNDKIKSDKRSQTLMLFGSTHIQLADRRGNYMTCGPTATQERWQSLLSFDNFEITGSIERYNQSEAVYLTDIRVKLRDANSRDTGFIQLPNHIPGMISSDDEPESDVQPNNFIIVNPIGKHLRVDDPHSGLSLILRRFDVHNTTAFYSIVLKLPNSLLKKGSGLLFEGCVDSIDIRLSTKRQKREVSKDCANFDIVQTKDPRAHIMQSLALSDELSMSENIDSSASSNVIGPLILYIGLNLLWFVWYKNTL